MLNPLTNANGNNNPLVLMAKFAKKVIKSKDNQPNRKFMEESGNKLPLNKGTFWWYEWALKYVPLVIMLAHWYGVFDFHSNLR